MYVVPPRECRNRSSYWLLLTSAYGLVNANAKWQEHCDQLFSELGFYQSINVPQLFYLKSSNELKVLAVKIVDAVLFSCKKQNIEKIISSIQSKYKLGTIVHGPSSFLFFGLQIIQDSDYSNMIHVDNKLEA